MTQSLTPNEQAGTHDWDEETFAPITVCRRCATTWQVNGNKPCKGKMAKITLRGGTTPSKADIDEFLLYCLERAAYMQGQRVAGDWREATIKPMRSQLESLITTTLTQYKDELLAALPHKFDRHGEGWNNAEDYMAEMAQLKQEAEGL
jgi:hypothetical protein